MATILTTTETDYHGNVTVTKRTLTPKEVTSRRGILQSKTIRAYNEGRGRRNASPYGYRARGSGQGVLPADEKVLTRDVFQAHVNPNAPATEPRTPVCWKYSPEGDKGRQYEQSIKQAKKNRQGR